MSGNKSKSPNLKTKNLSEKNSDGRRHEIAKNASLVSAASRTNKALTALEKAMAAIEAQSNNTEEFDKQFPNGLTKDAVAKLAGVNPRSLYTANLRSLGQRVGTFVDRINGKTDLVGEFGEESETDSNKSRPLATRYKDLKKRWDSARQDLRDTKLALQDLRSKYEKVLSENAYLKQMNIALESKVELFAKSGPTLVIRERPRL